MFLIRIRAVCVTGVILALSCWAAQRADGVSFSIGRNFSASNSTHQASGFIVPDTMGAVGPNHIGVMINGRWSVYDKNGGFLQGQPLDSFWSDNSGVSLDRFSFDPRILYDPHSERWYAAAVDNSRDANSFLIGVTASSDPTRGWRRFKIDADSNDTHWADFPMLGMNRDVVVVQANMFSIDESQPADVSTLVLPKGDLLARRPTVANATLWEETSDTNHPGFSAQPVVDHDNSGLPLPLLSSWNKSNGVLKKSVVAGTPENPTLRTGGGFIDVAGRTPAPSIDQPGPKADLESGGSRFRSNVIMRQHPWRANPSIWALHGVEFRRIAAMEWYEIDSVTDEILQSGVIADRDRVEFSYPSIAVNSAGDVVIGFSGARDADNDVDDVFMSTFLVVGESVNGTTTFGDITQTKAGLADYERLDGSDRNRWGDYSATVVDPTDENRFWTFQEFASDTDRWQIQVTEVIIGPLLLAGDTNNDGLVNLDDLNNVRNHFGDSGPNDGSLAGDAYPFDGIVGIDDLNGVRNNFGAVATTVPEPGGLTLAMSIVLTAAAFRKRHGRTP